MPMIAADARAARRRGRRGAGGQVRGRRPLLPRARRAAARGRRRRPGPRPPSPSRDTVAQLDARAGDAGRRRPAARRPRRRPTASTSTAGRRGCAAVVETRSARHGGLPRRAARRGAPAGPARRAGRADLPARRRRRRTPRRCATSRPPTRPPRRSTTSAWRRSTSWPRSTARSAPRWSAPTTSPQIFEAHARPTRAALRARRAARRGLRGRDGSARGTRCRDWFEVLPQAPLRRPGDDDAAPRRSTSRRPPTAAAAAPSSSTSTTRRSWGTFELESMAFHEGIPGHHLQLAIASRARRRAGVPQAPPQRGVRRGLGPLHRAAGRRDGALLRARRPDGHARRRLDARLPPRRRHRHARARLEPRSRRSTTWSPTPRSPRASCRPEIDRYAVTPGQACSYMVGRAGDPADARRGRGSARGAASTSRPSTPPSSTPARCRSGVLDEVVRTRLP